jgi:hypothetical protein
MGRYKLPKKSIQDWVPMDSDGPKGEVEGPYSPGSPDEGHAVYGSLAAHSPESIATDAEEVKFSLGLKRRRSSSSDNEKRPKRRSKLNSVVYCVSSLLNISSKVLTTSQCQCSTPHNPRIDLRCTGCPASPHKFFSNCKVEMVPLQHEFT